MKKERPVLFPEFENSNELPSEQLRNSLNDLALGHVYKIGEPSSLHYQHIYPAINSEEMNISELEDFNTIQGSIVKVTSILQMANDNKIAVLMPYKAELLLNEYQKIFAHIENSVSSDEIISLDLETKLTLSNQ